MTPENFQTFLCAIAIVSLTVGVFLENALGIPFTTILVLVGIVTMSVYLVQRGILRESPKFIIARKKLYLGLIVMAIGAIELSIVEVQVILNPTTLNVTLLSLAALVVLVGMGLLVITIWLTHVPK